ncbi:hypothetical protein TREPR_2121 [Treponema primitia ZAS-2]|uniref:Uncharacterized protein n=1 Tax=Treponema primitia (strain ATCC BAA-887 / DSM 12427 / ZAS-2) TaxID=545694 RepID=F5YJ73_TREPZ|nr:hypothetical protein [Treponema primitia]AEF83952.1 hypothetical protein TREPR_2121 [Treponema primitia ZAS-2]
MRNFPQKKPGSGKSLLSRGLSRRFRLGAALAFLALAGILFFALTRPTMTWYVEEELESPWRQVLAAGTPPRGFKGIQSLKPGEAPPAKAKGFLITRKRAELAEPVMVYPRLSFDLEYQGALVLALDPWMVFRNNNFPGLTRQRVESAGEGTLLIPGSDPAAVQAWTARFLERPEGEFPRDGDIWQSTGEALFRRAPFPRGAATFNWPDIWQVLLGKETSWVYAPLSRVRDLPANRSSILEASVFPGPGDNRFGLQAEILWAIPLGKPGKLEKAATWLKSGPAQTLIADTLRWLAASPDAKPFNPVVMSARNAWLTCSYVWECGEW